MFARVGSIEVEGRLKVKVVFSGCPSSNEELDAYLHKVQHVYDKNREFDILYDARNIGEITPNQLMTQARFMRANDRLSAKLVRKCAIVLSTDAAHTLLKTLFVLKKPACPLEVFRSLDEAKAYLRQ